MRDFPAPLSRADSDALADGIQARIDQHGWGLWAVEIRDVAPFAGYIGLARPRFEAHFTPSVEIGWRLWPEFWGRGYATEGVRAVLAFGFDELPLDEIVSFTTQANLPSRPVVERLGMTWNPAGDFDHQGLPAGHPLARHVLYRTSTKRARRSVPRQTIPGRILRTLESRWATEGRWRRT